MLIYHYITFPEQKILTDPKFLISGFSYKKNPIFIASLLPVCLQSQAVFTTETLCSCYLSWPPGHRRQSRYG